MIRIQNLHKAFDGHAVLKGIDLEIRKGEVVALIGGSGSGKSVLIKHVAGLLKPDRGAVSVDGKNMAALKGKERIALRARLGFLFQGGALFDSMTVYENVAFPLKEKFRLSEKRIEARVLEELENVGLAGAENKFPSQISGGMAKRAALARALVTDPEIMLFDEPTTGLDPVTGLNIIRLIDACRKRLHFTGIIVTHAVPRVFAIVDKVVMLHEGRIKLQGRPKDFMESADPLVQAFVGHSLEGVEDTSTGSEGS
ncbi:ABC transporter, ATP-binding protein [uncultured Desulfatiglans sp.]|nr:ABC transporter, ATP-binding protein [uncultured Desulfatiglans sp.]